METERVSAESHDLNFIEKVNLFSHTKGWGDAKDTWECACMWVNELDGAVFTVFIGSPQNLWEEKGGKKDVKKGFTSSKLK